MTGFKNVLISAFCITSLTACSVGPDYQAPSFSFLSEWIKQDTVIHSTQAPVSTTWWESFNDPLLTNYINQAVQKNKDIEIAKANILKARAARSQTNASFWPSLGFTSSNGKSKTTDNISTRYDSSFDASWEIDIFGGNRRALEAATARLNQNITSYHDVMLSVLSETARNYYEIRGLQKQIAFTENNVQLLNKTKDVIQARLNVGESSEFDLSRAQGVFESRSRTFQILPNTQ